MTEAQLTIRLDQDTLTIAYDGAGPRPSRVLGEYAYSELACANAEECYVKIGQVIVEGLRDEIFSRIPAPVSPVAHGLTDGAVASYLIELSFKTHTGAHVSTIDSLLGEESDDPELAQVRASWPAIRERLASFPA